MGKKAKNNFNALYYFMNKKTENRFYELYDLQLENIKKAIGQFESVFEENSVFFKESHVFCKLIGVLSYSNFVLEKILKHNNEISQLIIKLLGEAFNE